MKLKILAFAVALTLATNLICRADPLNTWTWRNPLPLGDEFASMTYGNGIYAAVSSSAVYTSTDGTNWNLRLWGANTFVSSVTYGNGMLMALGGSNGLWNGVIWTSFDGVDWTTNIITRQGGIYVYYDGSFMAYGDGKYVVVGYALDKYNNHYPVILSSSDLITWNQTLPAVSSISSISYGAGQFVIGCTGASLTSTDGINWTQGYSGTNNLSAITFGDGKFVGVGFAYTSYSEGIENIFVSQDGANWLQANLPTTITNVSIQSITFANDIFVAVGSHILTSPDGINWSICYTNSRWLQTIAYGINGFVASGSGGTGGPGAFLLTSPDGTNWTQRSSTATTANLYDVAFGNGLFAAVGSYSIGGTIIATSSGATNWTSHNLNGYGFLNRIIYGGNQFVAVGNGGTILTSTNGINWNSRNSGVTYPLFDVAYGNGMFHVVGYNGILNSTNGVTWTTNYSGYFGNYDRIVYGRGLFVFVGGGNIVSSPDGTHWSVRLSGLAQEANLCFGNGSFVVIWYSGSNTGAFTSPDGINWTPQNISNIGFDFQGLNHIGYGDGQFVIGDDNGGGAVSSSSDGLSWIQHTPRVSTLNGVAYGNGHFVVVGQAGTILESDEITPILNITTQPQSQMAQVGTNVIFAVAASGASPLNYEWQFNGQNISDATNATLTLNSVTAANSGGYSVVVSNPYGSVTSATASLAVLDDGANGNTPAQITATPVPPKPAGVKNLVFVTHGWEQGYTEPSPPEWVSDMANDISNSVSSDWQVVPYFWVDKAWTYPLDLFHLETKVMVNAQDLGAQVGEQIAAQGYQHVHLIAHSAGSALIQAAADAIRQASPSTIIHTTFLDPYVGLDGRGINWYGQNANWSDNYFAQDSATGAFTEGQLNHTYNVDVSWLYPDPQHPNPQIVNYADGLHGQVAFATHDWPHDFYIDTVLNTVSSSCAVGYGFPLSEEGGNWSSTSGDTEGQIPDVLCGSPSAIQNPFPLQTSPIILIAGLESAYDAGASLVGAAGFELNSVWSALGLVKTGGFQPAGETSTNTPAWLAVGMTVTNAVNFVQFDAAFTDTNSAQGLLTVYWNTNQIGMVDERVAATNSQTYRFELPGTVSGGLYTLSFRLDSFANSSSIAVTNVATGFVGVTQPITLAISITNGAPLLQLTAATNFTYLIESSTNLVNWTPTALLLNTNGSAQFLDSSMTNSGARYYRATLP